MQATRCKTMRMIKAIAAVAALTLIAACSSNNNNSQEPPAAGTTVSPGSIADFRQNVGDRVYFDTDMSSFTKTEDGRKAIFGMQALKRIAEPTDIAPAIAFLACDHARWITGEVIAVDGGSKL